MRGHLAVGIVIIIMIKTTHGLEKISRTGKGTKFANMRDEIRERRERQQFKEPETF